MRMNLVHVDLNTHGLPIKDPRVDQYYLQLSDDYVVALLPYRKTRWHVVVGTTKMRGQKKSWSRVDSYERFASFPDALHAFFITCADAIERQQEEGLL